MHQRSGQPSMRMGAQRLLGHMCSELQQAVGHLDSPRAIWLGALAYCRSKAAAAAAGLDDLVIGPKETLGQYLDRARDLYEQGATYGGLSETQAVAT